jgi:phage-related minor tail protein
MADNEINVKVVVDPSQAQAGSDQTAQAIKDAADSINASLSKVTTSSNSTAAAIRSGFAGIETDIRGLGATMQQVAGQFASASSSVASSLNQVAPASARAAAGMAGVGHASAGVRREFLVLGHEIATGNWTRFGGSLLVLGERMDILSKLTGATGVGLGVLAAAIAAVAVAAIKGAEEISALERSLELTGNRAGLTQDRYLEMAHAIAAANSQISVGNARSAVGATAGTGVFGPNAVQAVASAVAEITRLSGQTAEKVAADFAKMDDGVFKWATENKEAKNLISAADAEYARHLEEVGQKEEAEIFISQRVSERLAQVRSDLGILPSLWNEVKDAASLAWDAMMGVGRPDTLSQQIAKLKERKAAIMDNGGASPSALADALGGGVNMHPGDNAADLDKQIAALEAKKKAQDDAAKADAATAANNAAAKKGASSLDEMATRYDKTAAKAKELAEAQLALNNALKGLPAPAQRTAEQTAYAAKMQQEYNEAVAGINAKGEKKQTVGGASVVGRSEDNGELALIKDRLSFEQQELEKSYKANEISLKTYYDSRLQIVRQGMQAEMEVANKGVANAQSAAKHAQGPAQQAQAQAAIIRAKNQVALLNQKLAEQEATITQEQQEQQRLQDNKVATINIQANEGQQLAQVTRAQTLSQMEVALGKESKEQLIQQEMQYEDQRYAIEKQALEQRAALENQSVVQQAELNAQLEALESQHQEKLLQLQAQSAEQQNQLNKTLTGDMENDFAQAFGEIVSRTKTVKAAFEQLIPEFEKQLGSTVTKSLTDQLFGSGGLGGLFSKGVNAVFGNGLFGGSGGAGGAGAIASQTVSAQTTANLTAANTTVASMTVATMTVANSIGGGSGGGGAGGLGSLLGGLGGSSDFGGAFGFTASGATGSGEAVADGALSDSGSTGLSALMGIAAYAKGTNYVPSTGLALLHQGEAVVPASQNTPYAPASPNVNVNNQFVLPNNVDLRTQSQMAAMAGQSIQRALQRNT